MEEPAAPPAAPAFVETEAADSTPEAPKSKNKVVSTAAYFWLMLLYSIPVIGFIALVIMSFTVKNKNIRNFCKAILVWILIAVIIGLVLGILGLIFSKELGIDFSKIDFNTIWQGVQDGLGIK